MPKEIDARDMIKALEIDKGVAGVEERFIQELNEIADDLKKRKQK